MKDGSTNRRVVWLIALCLTAAGALVYSNTLHNPYVFDDTPWIVNNERIRSLSNIGEMLATTNRPLLEISLAVDYAIDGLNPVPYHLTNMLIHILAGLTLFGVIRRTLRLPTMRETIRDRSAWLAGAISLLWLVHPLNTQSVSYLIQRGESMMGMFYLLTLYCFIRYATGEGRRWAVCAIAACWLGVGVKEVIATAPLLVLLYDWVFIAQSWREPAKRWPVYLGLVTMWLPLTLLLARGLGGKDASAGLAMEAHMLSSWTYLLTQPQVILEVYLRKALWPSPLILDYGWMPAIPEDTPQNAWMGLFLHNVLFQWLIVVGIFCVGLIGMIRRTWWGFLIAAFFVILAPTSSFLPIADIAVEHRMYLSLISVIALLVMMAYGLLRLGLPKWVGPLGLALVVVVAMALGFQTFIRNYQYGSRITLWDSVAVARPYNPRGWHNLGRALEEDDRPDEAMACYEHIRKFRPDYTPVLFNMALLNFIAGRYDLSRQQFEKIISINSNEDKAYEYLARLSTDLDKAIGYLREAVRAKPDKPEYRQNLAAALDDAGRPAEAVKVIQDAIAYAKRTGQSQDVVDNFEKLAKRYQPKADQAPASP